MEKNDSSESEGFFLKPKSQEFNNSKDINDTNELNSYSERQILEITNNKKNEKEIKVENINEDLKNEETKEIKEEIIDKKESSDDFINNNEIYSYLKIDQKNYFSEMDNTDYSNIKEIISSFNEKRGPGTRIEAINEIILKFLGKISQNCGADPILISKYLSKEICKIRKLNKIKIEEYINYFFSLRYSLFYSTDYCLNLKALKYLGYILSYMFSKIHNFSIKDGKELRALIKNSIQKKVDPLLDYYTYMNENNFKENDIKSTKTFFWKKNRNKYKVPPELIFLINRFIKITTIEIEIDFQGEMIEDEEFKLISIFLLNVNYVFINLDHFKINFINQKMQYEIYTGYFRDLVHEASIQTNIIKKNRIKYSELLYNKKWNFHNNFNLELYRIIEKNNNKENFDKNNLIYDEYNLLYYNYKKKEINEEQMLNSTIEKSSRGSIYLNSFQNKNNQNKENNNIIDNKSNSNNVKIDNKIINIILKGKNNYIDTIKNNKKFLDLIVMIICSLGTLTKISNLDIVMNDSYNYEVFTHLLSSCDIEEELNLIDNNFHILDFIYNKIKEIKKLNIEINSLDFLTFTKALNFIHKNEKLNTLQISLFSSDVSYLRISLLKMYNQQIGEFKNLIEINNKNIETKIINDLLPLFIQNLSVLFEILKKKKNIEILGFNIDLPTVLLNKQTYIIPILKFILNILFLIDNNKCKLQKLTILSPSLVINNKILTGVNDIMSNININQNNKILNELNIQIQFYEIINIKNLITTRLTKLNIGDLDLTTFKNFVSYLILFKFCSKSILENLGIGLNKSITEFSTELKFLLRELFNIKIQSLIQLNIYTNVIINEKNYNYLINILKDNWISSYVLIFNPKSNDILNKYKNMKNEINFFVSPKLAKKLINSTEKIKSINDNNDIIYWYLKYLFSYKYYNSSSNFITKKNCINSILKYLYIEKNIKIAYNLEENEMENKEDKTIEKNDI